MYGPYSTVEIGLIPLEVHDGFKNRFSIFSSQEIGSSLVSLEMIFQALYSELFKFKFYSLGSKIKKIPEFSLVIKHNFT